MDGELKSSCERPSWSILVERVMWNIKHYSFSPLDTIGET
jgi:hypothetical protein